MSFTEDISNADTMITRVSVASDGTEADNGSFAPAISADGRFVAFESLAGLVEEDTNNDMDIYVHDRLNGTTERVSVASDGTQGTLDSFDPAISADGRFVVFASMAEELREPLTAAASEIFLHDRQTGTTEMITQAGDERFGSSEPTISADGRFIAFTSSASNLVEGDDNGVADIFVHDRQTGTTELVSISSDGTQGDHLSRTPAISADGRFIAFSSQAGNLIKGDDNGNTDTFVHDRMTGTTELVSVASDGTQGNGRSHHPAISADGRFVAFFSEAANLVVHEEYYRSVDVFVHDRVTGTTELVSVASDSITGSGSYPVISADGRLVVFESAGNLAEGAHDNIDFDIFLHDRQTGETVLVSVASDGTVGDNQSGAAAISADGRFIAFESTASNLVEGDTNGIDGADIFVVGTSPGNTAPIDPEPTVVIPGTPMPDAFFPAPGAVNETFDGLAGLDIIFYDFVLDDVSFTITFEGDDTVQFTSDRSGEDTLISVERLWFADVTYALDIGVGENAGTAYRTYQAAFDRTPDNAGLTFWIEELDDGLPFAAMGDGFVRSDEFLQVYGTNPTNEQFVDRLYENILGREGEQAGIDFWTGVLDRGEADKGDVLVGFADSIENVALVAPAINDGIFYG